MKLKPPFLSLNRKQKKKIISRASRRRWNRVRCAGKTCMVLSIWVDFLYFYLIRFLFFYCSRNNSRPKAVCSNIVVHLGQDIIFSLVLYYIIFGRTTVLGWCVCIYIFSFKTAGRIGFLPGHLPSSPFVLPFFFSLFFF